MSSHVFRILLSLPFLAWGVTRAAREAPRCDMVGGYPAPFGRHSFVLAQATGAAVTAMVDPATSATGDQPRAVRAQVMRLDDVTGFQAAAVRNGARASGGRAVFVRYGYGPDCRPYPLADDGFDSVGINGLYVGVPRTADRWIDGLPTFDIFRSEQYPLPQRDIYRLVRAPSDTAGLMTAAELFGLYRAIWNDSVPGSAAGLGTRIRRWIASDPVAARKSAAALIAMSALQAVNEGPTSARIVPLGGTFVLTIAAPDLDSIVVQGRTTRTARVWERDATRDSATGVPFATRARTYAFPLTLTKSTRTAQVRDGDGSCDAAMIVVPAAAFVAGADSEWTGETDASSFLRCAAEGSALAQLAQELTAGGAAPAGRIPVTFRMDRQGRVTLASTFERSGRVIMTVRGVRISEVTAGSSR